MNRRNFLQVASTGVFGSVFVPVEAREIHKQKAILAVQLYTIREAIEKDLEGALQKLADIGYRHVETAFWPPGISIQRAAKALKGAGMKVVACHVELPVAKQQEIFQETAHAFECNRMIWHGWPQDKRYSSLEGTRELIQLYNQSAFYAQQLNLSLGLHNHWWEFRNIVGGKPVYEWLLDECDPRIFFELDTYWIKVAGCNPADIIRKFGTRARYLHIKDGPAVYHDNLADDNPDPMVAVGKGTQRMDEILAAQQAEYLVVEMDKVAGDPFDALRESFQFLHGSQAIR